MFDSTPFDTLDNKLSSSRKLILLQPIKKEPLLGFTLGIEVKSWCADSSSSIEFFNLR